MGGRRDLRGRFQTSKPRVSRITTVESTTAKPSISQNTVSTIVDPDMTEAAQMAHATVCPHIPCQFDLGVELELTLDSTMITQ